jgi:hypothetical protein
MAQVIAIRRYTVKIAILKDFSPDKRYLPREAYATDLRLHGLDGGPKELSERYASQAIDLLNIQQQEAAIGLFIKAAHYARCAGIGIL